MVELVGLAWDHEVCNTELLLVFLLVSVFTSSPSCESSDDR